MAIIPSNQSILKFNNEKILGGSVLKKTIDSFEFKDFDIILFDTPPTMSSLVQEALSASDFYLIPTKPEFLAIEGVSQAMNFAKKSISNQININPVFLGVILNQVDTRRSSYVDFENELSYLLADKLLETKISNSVDIADSPYHLKTVEDFKDDSKSKIEFYQLANEILERMNINEKITQQSHY
jgi:chromosome partitioning protein